MITSRPVPVSDSVVVEASTVVCDEVAGMVVLAFAPV